MKAALEGALSGEGRMMMLVGEPGIGKTRTALELATYARLRGASVLWGRCYESEGAPPYWPWVQAIRDYVRGRDPEQLRSEMGAAAAEIAEIVPDVRERLPDVGEPPLLEDPRQARFRLFDSLTAFLKSAARAQPLVFVLDDLHWADEGSLRLLEFVARELAGVRLLLIGTYRDIELSRRHPLAQSLAELTRERLFKRLLLRGLGREDVGRFVEATCGISPPAELVSVVYAHTEGNPLFVTEVVRLLVQEGELTSERLSEHESWSIRIPEGVHEVIGRRLERLSEHCNETLVVASVIGREFGLDELERVIGDLAEDRLLELLDEALSARVIEELPRSLGRYQFTHALIQETLAEELSLTRRVRLHARIAEALEQLYGADADAHAAEFAHHFGEAEALVGPEKLVHYSLIAGESALAAHAHEQAVGHFERALAAKVEQAMDDETAALLFGLARAQLATLAPREWGPLRDEHAPCLRPLRRCWGHPPRRRRGDSSVPSLSGDGAPEDGRADHSGSDHRSIRFARGGATACDARLVHGRLGGRLRIGPTRLSAGAGDRATRTRCSPGAKNARECGIRRCLPSPLGRLHDRGRGRSSCPALPATSATR